MKTLREQLYENEDFTAIETSKLESLFCSLREYSHQQGSQMQYDGAQRAAALSRLVCDELKLRDPVRESDQSTFLNNYGSFEDSWQRRFEEFDADTDAKMRALQDRQRTERRDFERTWNQDMPRQYRKPSPGLLQLRRVEKSLALCGQFDGAKAVHAEVEATAVREWDQQQQSLIRDYQSAHQKLAQRHESEVANMRQTRAHWRTVLQQRYEQEKVAVTNRELVVETKRKEIQKGYRTMNRAKAAIGTGSGYALAGDETGAEDVLLGPLKPPNDPQLVEVEKRRRREMNRRKLEYHRQNAEATLAKYSLNPDMQPANDEADGQKEEAEGRPEEEEEEQQPALTEVMGSIGEQFPGGVNSAE
jgi:hypothetical protein